MDPKQKMNPETKLTEVGKLIERTPGSMMSSWNLIWNEGKMKLVSKPTTPPCSIILMTLTRNDINSGLTNMQWNKLRTKISNLLEQQLPCPKQYKPLL